MGEKETEERETTNGCILEEKEEERETMNDCVLVEIECVLVENACLAEAIKEAGLGLGRLLLGQARGAHSAPTVG